MFFGWLPSHYRRSRRSGRAGPRRRPERRLRSEPLEARHLLALLPAGPAFVLAETPGESPEWVYVNQALPDGQGNVVGLIERSHLDEQAGLDDRARSAELVRWNAAGERLGPGLVLVPATVNLSSFDLLALPGGRFLHSGWRYADGGQPQYWVQLADLLAGTVSALISATEAGYRVQEIVPSGDGGFWTLWGDAVWPNGDQNLYARRFDPHGEIRAPKIPLAPESAGEERYFDAAELPGGDLLVAWQGPPGVSGGDLFLGRWNSEGVPRGAPLRIDGAPGALFSAAKLVVEGDGHVVLVWMEGTSVHGQTFTPELQPEGDPVVIEADVANYVLRDLTASPGGYFLLLGTPSSTQHVGRIWSPGSVVAGPWIELTAGDAPGASRPVPFWDSDGSFLVPVRTGYSGHVMLRRFLTDGTRVGSDVSLGAELPIWVTLWPPVPLPNGDQFLVAQPKQSPDVRGTRLILGQVLGTSESRPGVVGYATGDGQAIDEGTRLSSPVSAVVVEFSHPLRAADSPDSVTRRENWTLISERLDFSSRIERVVYSVDAVSGRSQARLEFVAPLTAGSYELRLSPEVRTAEGLPLDPRQGIPSGGPFRRRFQIDLPSGPEAARANRGEIYPLTTAIAIDPSGRSAVVWGEASYASPYLQMFVQVFTPAGRPLGEPTQVGSQAVTPISGFNGLIYDPVSARPAIAALADGTWVVGWTEESAGAAGQDVWLARLSAEGIPLGETFRPHRSRRGEQSTPALAARPGGGFFVAWQSDQAGDFDVYLQAFDALGEFAGPQRRANSNRTGRQERPDVAVDADGDVVVVWTSAEADPGWNGLFARRYDAASQPTAREVRLNQFDFGEQRNPSVAIDPDGDFVVAFEYVEQLPQSGYTGDFPAVMALAVRRFDASGRATSDELFLPVGALGRDIFYSPVPLASRVSMAPAGTVRVTISQYSYASFEGGIYLQSDLLELSRELRLLAPPRRLTENTEFYTAAAVAMNASGDTVVAWLDSDRSSAEVRVQPIPGPPQVLGVWAGEGAGAPLRPGQALSAPLDALGIELTQDLAPAQTWNALVEVWHDGVRLSDEQVTVDLERRPLGDRSRLLVHLARIERGQVELRLRDGLVDRWGAALDGEGNARPGGDYVLRFSVAPRLPGDVNGDGVLGLADYLVWSVYFGRVGEGLAADLDGDGQVGTGDYTAWAAQDPFGRR